MSGPAGQPDPVAAVVANQLQALRLQLISMLRQVETALALLGEPGAGQVPATSEEELPLIDRPRFMQRRSE